MSTTSIPTNLTAGANTDCSLIIVGKFDELLYGIKGPLVVDISRSAADSGSSAFSQMQVWLRVYIRLDVAVLRPRAFTVVSGVR